MPAVTLTGGESVACCQPDADSPVKLAVASGVPSSVQRWPMRVPVQVAPL